MNAKQSHDFQRRVQVLWEWEGRGCRTRRQRQNDGRNQPPYSAIVPFKGGSPRFVVQWLSDKANWRSLSARDFFSVNRLSRRNRRLSCRLFLLPSDQRAASRRLIHIYERNPELITERNNRGRLADKFKFRELRWKKWMTDKRRLVVELRGGSTHAG